MDQQVGVVGEFEPDDFEEVASGVGTDGEAMSIELTCLDGTERAALSTEGRFGRGDGTESS